MNKTQSKLLSATLTGKAEKLLAGLRIDEIGHFISAPFAPGATGNIADEYLVFLFERCGVSTGINLPTLIDEGLQAAEIEGGVTGGAVRKVLSRSSRQVDTCSIA